MLRIVNIEGGYTEDNNILKNISFEIPNGETIAVLGQNGSGKSSLVKAILNTLPFKNGEIWFDSENISNYPIQKIINRGVGVFLQGGKVFPHLTVRENILLAGRILPNKNLASVILELQVYIPIFEENKLWNLQASYLSGGQRNMLALFMILLNKPKLLILDEVTAGLSENNSQRIYKILNSYQNENNVPILLIEQNVFAAINFSQRLIYMQNGIFKRIVSKNEITMDYLSEINSINL